MLRSYSLHAISSADDVGFNADDYSRFKFGDIRIAKAFGVALARGFIATHMTSIARDSQLVVLSSPYCFIPTATFYLKNYFINTLNAWLVAQQRPVAQEAKIHRTNTYTEDYGALSAAERHALIGNDRFHIDRFFLEGKTAVFLDDIRITGSHERVVLNMMHEARLGIDMFMVYYAELVNPDIHPNIENLLNYHFVKSIGDIDRIIRDGDFGFNTRVIKYLLGCETSEFVLFLNARSNEFIYDLYSMAIGNGYHLIERFRQNMIRISEYLQTTNLKHTLYGN